MDMQYEMYRDKLFKFKVKDRDRTTETSSKSIKVEVNTILSYHVRLVIYFSL